MAAKIFPGRWTAEVDEPLVVFLIGMRVNRWWRVRRWWQVSAAMPRMLKALEQDPELGLLHTEFFAGRRALLVQYWRSFDHLERFATDRDLPHAAAWGRFMRELSGSGDVGIYHETYVVEPGDVEALYGDMPLFGLAAATSHVPVTAGGRSARKRMAATAAHAGPVPTPPA